MSLKEQLKEKLAAAIKDNLKVEEGEFVNPWSDQDKASVLQQSRCFSETPVDSRKCLELLTRVLYLLQQGEKFTPNELTKLFFDVTKLFHIQNSSLRRMVYLVIKELEPSENEVFICMSCLIKDMNGSNECFKANSIRVLARVLDPAMTAQIDRYLKTAIVDKNPFVASSALVCGITLHDKVPDVVKRWVSEVQETINSKHAMVQFHAFALLYEMKRMDRLALHKVVISLAKTAQKSPMAECLLIRYATQALIQERDSTVEKVLIGYLDSCLRHKSEMVTYESARAFCQLVVVDNDGGQGSSIAGGYDLASAITVLQLFLTSPKPVLRFGAIKTLNKLAQKRPQLAARCNVDMEPLLTDSNRNTATLALTTLLKTGSESNVDRLVKQVASFMSEISDVFKIEVVRAVKGLCLQYPAKYKICMAFLSSNLREDGSIDFKKELVDAMILVIGQVPAAREVGLSHLCEYIEDCEFPNLCTRVLGFLADEVPSTSTPSKFIRHIYNRLILESAMVRAAAVDALSKIAMKCSSLRKDILVLLQHAENDNDDEVRDRICLYISVLEKSADNMPPPKKTKGIRIVSTETLKDEARAEELSVAYQTLMTNDLPFSLDAMYDNLLDHISSERKDDHFSFDGLPSQDAYLASVQVQAALQQADRRKSGQSGATSSRADPSAPPREAEKASPGTELLRMVNEIVGDSQSIGQLQHSCRPKPLTESEAEYTVQVIKHMFRDHVVLELYVSNTVQGITLQSVEVQLTGIEPTWTELGAAAIDKLEYGQQASAYVVLQNMQRGEVDTATGSLGAKLKFTVLEEGDDMGYEDVYPVENVTISSGDYMFPRALAPNQFKSVWEQLAAQGEEVTEKVGLSSKSLEAAVEHIIQTLNMEPCDKTGAVESGVRGHTLLMSGTFNGGHSVVVKALVGVTASGAIAAQIKCRAKTGAVASAVAKSLG